MSVTAKDRVHIGEVVNIGVDLKCALEVIAREECRDVTSLTRNVLRQYVAERRIGESATPSFTVEDRGRDE
jgi:hypothetical protein